MHFVHLRTHSSYSLSEGAIKLDDLIDFCVKQKMPSIGLTDNGNLFCSLEFSLGCCEKGIKPIIGCVLQFDAEIDQGSLRKLDKIVLLAKNHLGYKNLLKLVSDSFLEHTNDAEKFITFSELKKYHEGLIVLTAGFDGTIGRLILENRFKDAENFLYLLKKTFSDNLYVELVRRKIASEDRHESYLLEMAYKQNIPLVATNDVYFAAKDMHEAHDALICIAEGRYLVEEDRKKSNPELYFKSAAEMCELFADLPEAIQNTIKIAKRCSYFVEERSPMLPKPFKNESDLLKQYAFSGLQEKLVNIEKDEHVKYFARLEFELDVITKMAFSGYFLIVSDFIKWSKSQNIPVGPGRGSGAGSLVAWSLSITDLDPIKFGLLFERFLNPERISMPDFDIDFCQERRDEVIKYVQNKYGATRVAQIITFGKLQARAVIRDVGRVLQMPYAQVDRISKMVPFNPVKPVTLAEAITLEPMMQKEQKENDQVAKLLSIALKLEGLHRHASTHAAGIVIADRDLEEFVPLYKDAKSEMLVVQYSMGFAEKAGLVKFDFLGLKTLTVIAGTCELIKKHHPNFDINSISLDDEKTYSLLSSGNSTAIFQFESAGMRDTLRKLRPDSIKDLMALGALYRPGPMENIPLYIACKHGKQKPDYLHPLLKEILLETFGVIIYQEQVLQVAQKLAGYSLGAADILRKAMGKKIAKEMDAQRALFVEGAIKNNVDKNDAVKIFDLVAKFAGYGFNRAHAASYAIISYQTAFLKANFPVQFLVSCLNNEIDDTDKLSLFITDAKNQAIKIIPPDINESEEYFIIANDTIRFALGALKNVGVAAMKHIVDERKKNGKFIDIVDFAKRITAKILNKRQLENLIKAGVFDSISSNRRQLFESVEFILDFNNLINKEQKTDQMSLFSNSSVDIATFTMSECEEWNDNEKLSFEFESFGLYLSKHPLDSYKNQLINTRIKSSEYLKNELQEGLSVIHLAGVPLQVKTRMSPKGRFVSVLMSDYYGNFEVSIFNNELLSSSMDLINSNVPLSIIADVRKDEGGVRITASNITPLDETLANSLKAVKVWLNDVSAVTKVKNLVQGVESGNTTLYLSIVVDKANEVEMELPRKYMLTLPKTREIEQIDGVLKLEFA